MGPYLTGGGTGSGDVLGLLLGPVDGFQNFITPFNRRLNEFLAAAQLLDKPDILHFALIPLEGAVDGLSFFNFDNQHAVNKDFKRRKGRVFRLNNKPDEVNSFSLIIKLMGENPSPW